MARCGESASENSANSAGSEKASTKKAPKAEAKKETKEEREKRIEAEKKKEFNALKAEFKKLNLDLDSDSNETRKETHKKYVELRKNSCDKDNLVACDSRTVDYNATMHKFCSRGYDDKCVLYAYAIANFPDRNETKYLNLSYEICDKYGLLCRERLAAADYSGDVELINKIVQSSIKHHENGKMNSDEFNYIIMNYSDDDELKQKIAPDYFENQLKKCKETENEGCDDKFRTEAPKDYYDNLMEILTKGCDNLNKPEHCLNLAGIFGEGITDYKGIDIVPVNENKYYQYRKRYGEATEYRCRNDAKFNGNDLKFNVIDNCLFKIFDLYYSNDVSFEFYELYESESEVFDQLDDIARICHYDDDEYLAEDMCNKGMLAACRAVDNKEKMCEINPYFCFGKETEKKKKLAERVCRTSDKTDPRFLRLCLTFVD